MNSNWEFTKSALMSLSSELKCPICGNLPESPHILWCKHSFCKDCILPAQNCPTCGFPVTPQQLMPDIMLSQLLNVMNVAAEVSKWSKVPSSKEKQANMNGKINKVECDKNINDFQTPPSLKTLKEKRTLRSHNSPSSCNVKSTSVSRLRNKSVAPETGTECKKLSDEQLRKATTVASPSVQKRKKITVSTPKTKSSSTAMKSHILFSGKKSNLPNKVNVKGETPLQIACRQGKLSLVQQLLREGAEPNVQDYARWTPLCDAVICGNIEIVRALLEAGAGVNTPSNLNTTALIEAVLKNDEAIIQLLIDYGPDIYQRTCLNNTAFSLANDDLKCILKSCKNIVVQPHPRVRTVPKGVLISNLSQENTDKIVGLCKRFNLTLSTSYTEEITHVIVEKTSENLCGASTSVMLGILNGCSVVGMDWVSACLGGELLLPADGFEPSGTEDYPDSNVFQRARLNKEQLLPRLFDGCHISLQHDQVWTPACKQDLVALVTAAGAQYQGRECDAERIPLAEQTVMFHTPSDSPLASVSHIILYQSGAAEPLLKYNMAHIKSFSVTWFMKCIKTFSIS